MTYTFEHTDTGRVVSVENAILISEYNQNPDFQRFIMVPVYSEVENDDGYYDVINYRREYVD